MHLKIDAGEIINIAFTKKSFKSNKFSDALAFLALMTITGLLTDSLKLENGHFVCLAVLALPLLYSIQSGQSSHPDQSGQHGQFGQPYQCDYPGQSGDQTVVTLVSLFSLVTPVNLVIPIRLVTLVTLCKICTLHNFQFYLAHLRTDFQSCLSMLDCVYCV